MVWGFRHYEGVNKARGIKKISIALLVLAASVLAGYQVRSGYRLALRSEAAVCASIIAGRRYMVHRERVRRETAIVAALRRSLV